mgnify:FL=1|jgi:anaerobic magnesium-protoporphyrin IX monomethyl ester cyclase
MKIGCVYSIGSFLGSKKPLPSGVHIHFGIATIITVLEQQGHDVELFVVAPETDLEHTISKYVHEQDPKLFLYTAVTTQYWLVTKVAKHVKLLGNGIFQVLGGHHASLDSDAVIQDGVFDAICVGEGESAMIDLADNIESGNARFKPINNIWYYDKENNSVIKNNTAGFIQELDELPYINRKIWDKFMDKPNLSPSILLGRGCPFKCAYCSNHAMARLSEGEYVRFRSPEHIVGEIDKILSEYDDVEAIYLEVETFGANRKASFRIFDKLAEYNSQLAKPIKFGANLALTSNYMRNEERCHELLSKAKVANLVTFNVGLESGSERMRRDVLNRPKYTNDELVRFCQLAGEYEINVIFFVLIGLPGEALEDYLETVKTARKAQPDTCEVNIYYPYLGTDLAAKAISLGLVHPQDLVTKDYSTAERSRAVLNLEGFSARRIRLEYILFWFRVYSGHWSMIKLIWHTLRSFLMAYPKTYSRLFAIRDIVPGLSYYRKKNRNVL